MLRRLVLLTLPMLLTSGCATSWLVLEVGGLEWTNETTASNIVSLVPPEKRVRVSAEYVAAQPVGEQPSAQAAPARPGPPADAAPAPLALGPQGRSRPRPEGALRLVCSVETRNPRERIHETGYRYVGAWKMMTGFLFVAEALFGASALWGATREREVNIPALVVGTWFALDALGTGALFWRAPQERHRVSERVGAWEERSRSCPSTLVVETSTGQFPVAAGGEVPGLGEWLLGEVVWSGESAIALRAGESKVELKPTTAQRCQWSDLSQSPAPFCQRLGAPAPAADAPLALPVDEE